MPTKSRNTRFKKIGATVVAAMSIGSFSPVHGGAASDFPTMTVEHRQTVTNLRNFPKKLKLDGVVEPVVQTLLSAQISGRILEINAEAGQKIRKGAVLVRLDARESQQTSLAAEAAASNAEAHLERTIKLFQQKFVSAAAVDRARADFTMAKAQAKAAGAGISHAVLSAPMDGLVAKRHVEVGEVALPGNPLLTLYQPDRLRVTVALPQGHLDEIQSQPAVRVRVPGSGHSFPAAGPVEVMPVVDPVTHTAQLRVPLPAGTDFLPGMSVVIEIDVAVAGDRPPQMTHSRNNARLLVPVSSILRRGEVTGVYVVSASGYPVLRQVRLGPTQGNEVEILAGLTSGETIVTEAVQASVSKGKPVRVNQASDVSGTGAGQARGAGGRP